MLRVDGGGAANGLLMQMQADQLQVPVERPEVGETTALGAAFLAGLGTGVWSSLDEIAATWRLDRRFEPGARDEAGHARLVPGGRAVQGLGPLTRTPDRPVSPAALSGGGSDPHGARQDRRARRSDRR